METRTGQSRPFGSGGQGLGPHSVSARNINLLLPDGGVKSDEPSEVVITKEMEAEEQQLMEEGERKEEEMMKKAQESWQKDSQDMRFKRLQHLLQKSNIYSKFLLTKMEQQQQEV
uniref:Uncharacterized protein n=1 Tax=Cyprinodon variegatus TaxID=28743 RepID=A0A3Q2DSS1_CYPVA